MVLLRVAALLTCMPRPSARPVRCAWMTPCRAPSPRPVRHYRVQPHFENPPYNSSRRTECAWRQARAPRLRFQAVPRTAPRSVPSPIAKVCAAIGPPRHRHQPTGQRVLADLVESLLIQRFAPLARARPRSAPFEARPPTIIASGGRPARRPADRWTSKCREHRAPTLRSPKLRAPAAARSPCPAARRAAVCWTGRPRHARLAG